MSVNEMIDRALRNTLRSPRYAYLAPQYAQAKRIAWDYLKQYTRAIPGATPNEADLRVDLPHNNSRLFLLGAENPGSLRGIYLDGVILDEYAEMNPQTWTEVIRPTLVDRNGWAIFLGTPKGQNHFYKIYNHAIQDETWYAAMFKASETGVVPEHELKTLQREMDEDEYNQEMECSFAAGVVGAYYAKLLEEAKKSGRVTRVPYDPSLPVYTAWDLGISDSTAIWFFQQLGQEVRLIDYYEDSGASLHEYVKALKEKPYIYEDDILPHDAAARDLSTGKSREETLRSLGRRTIINTRHQIADGIHAVRMLLPRCYFDAQKCKRGLDALENYVKKWDSKNMIFSSKPLHNWASNGSDAFRTLAMGIHRGNDRVRNKYLPRETESKYDIWGRL